MKWDLSELDIFWGEGTYEIRTSAEAHRRWHLAHRRRLLWAMLAAFILGLCFGWMLR